MSIGQKIGLVIVALLVIVGVALVRRRRNGGNRRRFTAQSRVRTWSKSDRWSPWR